MNLETTLKFEPSLRLYYANGACSLASHVALEEAGAVFDTVRIDLASGQQHSPDYRAVNPRGRIPTLIVAGTPISETIAILTCIDRLYPDAGLLPSTPLEAARAHEMMSWLASSVHIAIAQILRTARFTSDPEATPILQREGRDHLAGFYRTIDAGLEGPWVLGEQYTVLDPYLLVFWRWGERLGMDMGAFKRWSDHTARVLARPAVASVLARETARVAE